MSRSFPRTCPVFENLGDLQANFRLWASEVIALPMKIAGGTGGPLRVRSQSTPGVIDASMRPAVDQSSSEDNRRPVHPCL